MLDRIRSRLRFMFNLELSNASTIETDYCPDNFPASKQEFIHEILRWSYSLSQQYVERTKTTILQSQGRPVNVRELEKFLKNNSIKILALEYQSYKGRRPGFVL